MNVRIGFTATVKLEDAEISHGQSYKTFYKKITKNIRKSLIRKSKKINYIRNAKCFWTVSQIYCLTGGQESFVLSVLYFTFVAVILKSYEQDYLFLFKTALLYQSHAG